MPALQLTDEQLDTIRSALRCAEAQFNIRGNCEDEPDARQVWRRLADEYGALYRKIKDGQLAALVHQGPPSEAGRAAIAGNGRPL